MFEAWYFRAYFVIYLCQIRWEQGTVVGADSRSDAAAYQRARSMRKRTNLIAFNYFGVCADSMYLDSCIEVCAAVC